MRSAKKPDRACSIHCHAVGVKQREIQYWMLMLLAHYTAPPPSAQVPESFNAGHRAFRDTPFFMRKPVPKLIRAFCLHLRIRQQPPRTSDGWGWARLGRLQPLRRRRQPIRPQLFPEHDELAWRPAADSEHLERSRHDRPNHLLFPRAAAHGASGSSHYAESHVVSSQYRLYPRDQEPGSRFKTAGR